MSNTIQLSRTGRNIAAYFEAQNAWIIFALLCLGYATTAYIQDTMIVTKDVYYNTLGEQWAAERIDELFTRKSQWAFITYLILPLLVISQAMLVTLCLNCGTIIMNYKVKFSTLFKLVLCASVVFLIDKLVFSFVLLFSDIKVVDDLLTTNKLALSGYIDRGSVPKWLMYALNNISISEFFFWLLLAFGISRLLNKSLKSSFGFIATTYGLGLLIWVIFIIFLQLNFT